MEKQTEKWVFWWSILSQSLLDFFSWVEGMSVAENNTRGVFGAKWVRRMHLVIVC